MNAHPKRKLLADMDKTQLLRMREEGMSDGEIAEAVGCCKMTIYRALGPLSPEQRQKRQREGGRSGAESKWSKTSEGGYTVERKMMSFMHKLPEPEPVKAVLVMKSVPPTPIPLHGAVADYTISADRQTVEIENELGRVLMQLPAEKIPTFIEELTAIQKNIGSEKPMAFWG